MSLFPQSLVRSYLLCGAFGAMGVLIAGTTIFTFQPTPDSQHADKHREEVESPEGSKLIKYPNLDTLLSLVELICDPEKYHGKKIAVEGVFIYEFEGTALYLNRESANYGIGANAIWVELSSLEPGKVPPPKQWKKFHKQYVRIEGYYNKNNMGHFGSFHGAIERISRVYLLHSREDDD